MNSFHVISLKIKKNKTKDEKEFLNTEKNCYVSYLVEEHTRYMEVDLPVLIFSSFSFSNFFFGKRKMFGFFKVNFSYHH